jgi:DNA (cytosine-5)-methyltransferase 1
MRSVELFSGAGGLAMGCELAGFVPSLVVEWDKWSCDTVRLNQARDYPLVRHWDVRQEDARQVDFSALAGQIDLVSGGPPCQPFSMGGKHQAHHDARDMFPTAVRAVRTLSPKAFLFENVRGLTRPSFLNYFQYIQLSLSYPALCNRPSEGWEAHFARLQAHHTSARRSGGLAGGELRYRVTATLVNAADYGVPQQRYRVFLVGLRDDIDARWSFPSATHSADALLKAQWVTGEYWDRHKVPLGKRPAPTMAQVKRLAASAQLAAGDLFSAPRAPWRTVRDAIDDLPQATANAHPDIANHVQQPGAKTYPGHTGSLMDWPAKALKAGDHGVPGGENMVVSAKGPRYFTVRESARLQTFPDSYQFSGSWSETMRQLGNAVPVLLAQRVASSIAQALLLADARLMHRVLQERPAAPARMPAQWAA